MDYVRIGGVCLLLMVIAAALPVNVLAQTPQTSANGAAPIISQSLLSESKAQGETISAETLAKRNSGLKPLGTKSSSKASGVQTSGQSQTPISTSQAAAATVTATTSTESSSTATQTQSGSQSASVPAKTSSSTAAAASVTPVQTAQETGAGESSSGSAAGSQNVAIASTTVTPPDNVSPGTVVSNNVTSGNSTASENVSQNGTELQLPPENASENATENSEATSKEPEAGTDRIWREGVNPRGTYTWTPQSFSGFFYDLKNDVGTERLTIDLPSSGRSIDSGGLTYSTKAQDTDFQFGDWYRTEFARGNFAPWDPANPDLAILLEMVRQADRPLFGPPPGEVLDPIPWVDIRQAMLDSIPDLLSYLDGDERNVVLTFARIWTTLATGVTRSKDGAADWALPLLPPEHRAVLRYARANYLDGAPEEWGDLLPRVRPFVDCVIDKIETTATREPSSE